MFINQRFPGARLSGTAYAVEQNVTKDIYNKSILVVDDDESMRRALERVLTNEGATVTCSSWAGSAIGTLTERKTRVDLVIIDLNMPFISGLTAVIVIHDRCPKLPIIVLTAFGGPDVEAECLSQGAVAFLEKPLNSHVLINAVQKAFSLRESVSNVSRKVLHPEVEAENGLGQQGNGSKDDKEDF